MTEFEKVEKLRERANVTYEEARAALNEAGGDLLDAMVLLEKQGKTTGPRVSTYKTTYEEQKGYEEVVETANREDAGERLWESIKRLFRVIWKKLTGNSLSVINGDGKEAMRIPLIVPVVLLILGWYAFIPVMVIMLFFGFRYRIVGSDEMPNANEIFDRAGDMAQSAADHVREEWKKQ